MNGLLRDPKHLCVLLFGAVFEVKLVDQLIIFRREQIQNITQGLAHHLLNCLIFRGVVIINKFMEPLVSVIFTADQRTHLRFVLVKAFRAVFDVPFRPSVGLEDFLCDLHELKFAGHGVVNIEKIILFSHTPDLLCDFLNLVRFKKSGDQGYSAIYGSHAKRGRI